MLGYYRTEDADAVEKFVCEPFEKLKRHPMKEEDGKLLLKLLMIKDQLPAIPQKEKPFLYQVIEKRIEHCFSFKIQDVRLILLLTVIAGSPGCAIMYLAYLQYWCKKHSVQELDLETFGERIFPWGFPSQNDLGDLWDKQKVKRNYGDHGSDNLLDYGKAYLSIQLKDFLWEDLPKIEM